MNCFILIPHIQAVKWRLQCRFRELVATDAERTLQYFRDYLNIDLYMFLLIFLFRFEFRKEWPAP
jgi:2-phosphoglycerate kinase